MAATQKPTGEGIASRAGPIAYLRATTGLFNSLVLVVPVFLLYQVGVIYQLSTRGGSLSINGADYLTLNLVRLCRGSLWLYAAVVVVVALGLAVAVSRLARRDTFEPRICLPMLLESTAYALLFATTIHLIRSAPAALSTERGLSALTEPIATWEKIFQSLGAGFNEEVLFRLGVLGGIVVLGKAFAVSRRGSIAVAFLVSAIAFSAFHFMGPYAESFGLDPFMYRFWAGILLGTIFWWRGLAVAVYTHAFYDLYFFFVLGGS